MPVSLSKMSPRHSWERVTSSIKSVWLRLYQDRRGQEHFYQRQEDEDINSAEDSKLIEDKSSFDEEPHHEEPHRSTHVVYRVSLTVSLLITAFLTSLLIALAVQSRGRVFDYLHNNATNTTSPRRAIVLASWSQQNVSWLSEIDDDWEIHRYISDSTDPSSPSTVPRNQGREAMAYLTHIIKNYDTLADYTVFTHGHRRSWHQTEAMPLKLSALNITALYEHQYISFRCNIGPSCTEESHISAVEVPEGDKIGHQKRYMPGFWATMFPNTSDHWGMGPPPPAIAAPCCAQFAVTKEAIQLRSKEFYEMYRLPLTRDLREYEASIGKGIDGYSMGLVYEMVWHMVFGKPAVHCPSEEYAREVLWSDAITCDRYIGSWPESWGWENIECVAKNSTQATVEVGEVGGVLAEEEEAVGAEEGKAVEVGEVVAEEEEVVGGVVAGEGKMVEEGKVEEAKEGKVEEGMEGKIGT